MVAVPPLAIAISIEIIGVASIVKACNACEIESQLAHSTALAPHTPGFHDVVQCECKEKTREIFFLTMRHIQVLL